MKKWSDSKFVKAVRAEYGSLSKLKKHLKSIAVNEYDCWTASVELMGCRVAYTSNPNHWCEFYVSIPCVVFHDTRALGKQSITKAGALRMGGYKYYIKF